MLHTQAGVSFPETPIAIDVIDRRRAHRTNDAQFTAPERETVILINDEDEFAEITTHQRTWVTKLRKNSAAQEIEELSYGSTSGARFRVPAKLVSVRTKRVELSEEDKARRAARLNSTV
jgi:hypothetical protein